MNDVVKEYVRAIISGTALLIFGTGYFVALFRSDVALQQLFVGAVIGMAMNPFNYYLGSSSSSDKKDQIIAKQQEKVDDKTTPELPAGDSRPHGSTPS